MKKGSKMTKESKKKMSESRKGMIPWNKGKKLSKEHCKKLSESHKGQVPWIKGKTHSKETKLKISKSHTGLKLSESHKRNIGKSHIGLSSGMKGLFAEKHPGWKGGTLEWWREKLIKNNKECCLCKSSEYLEMHHKDRNRKNNARSNLIILCRDCHKFWHVFIYKI